MGESFCESNGRRMIAFSTQIAPLSSYHQTAFIALLTLYLPFCSAKDPFTIPHPSALLLSAGSILPPKPWIDTFFCCMLLKRTVSYHSESIHVARTGLPTYSDTGFSTIWLQWQFWGPKKDLLSTDIYRIKWHSLTLALFHDSTTACHCKWGGLYHNSVNSWFTKCDSRLTSTAALARSSIHCRDSVRLLSFFLPLKKWGVPNVASACQLA